MTYIFRCKFFEVIVLGYDSRESAEKTFCQHYAKESIKGYTVEEINQPYMIERDIESE